MGNNRTVFLVTGAAGFIGFHMVMKLLKNDFLVYGIDNLNDYYDVNLKISRLMECGVDHSLVSDDIPVRSSLYSGYTFQKSDITNHVLISNLFSKENFDYVIHLAAQPGVRYSIINPKAYTHSNIDGFLSILEACRNNRIRHLLFASTSSVYGLNSSLPYDESLTTDHPISLYAATKKANEVMAHSYSHLYGVPTTGMRFFTVYGPWSRPDMAMFLFAESIVNDKPIQVFNGGKMIRDFTFIDDIIESMYRLAFVIPKRDDYWNSCEPGLGSSLAPYSIYNIGNNNAVELLDYIAALELSLGKKAIKDFIDLQSGDVLATYANTTKLVNAINFKPNTDIGVGVQRFVDWYRKYYNRLSK